MQNVLFASVVTLVKSARVSLDFRRKIQRSHGQRQTYSEVCMFHFQRSHRKGAVTAAGSRGRSEQRWMSPPLCSAREGASPPDRNTIKLNCGW